MNTKLKAFSLRTTRRTFAVVVVSLLILSANVHSAPRHVYLTWQGDTSTTMTVNFHTEKQGDSIVLFDKIAHKGKEENYPSRITGKAHQIPGLNDNRWIHVVELTGLEPNTDYYFVAGNETNGYSKERKFRTIPAGDEPLRFISGGDMNIQKLVRKLLAEAGKLNPDFAIIGGDIAYENGELDEYPEWDVWLKNWEKFMVTPDGRTVPMMLAIGNHEVNDLTDKDPALRSPGYIGNFAQANNLSYFSKQFGKNLVIIALDSGHLTPHDGEQKAWLETELKRVQAMPYKFAIYHVPLYPTIREYEGKGSVAGRAHWLPLFDQYGLTTAFENHDHAFKRTHRLKAGKIDPTGTLYLGDGCFGVEPREMKEKRWYQEVASGTPHFWLVDLTPTKQSYTAINEKGDTIDHHEIGK